MERIHFVGVGGVGMGSLARALAVAGYEISGSDTQLYDPMKGVLESAAVKFFKGYQKETIDQISPDYVVIGNVVRRDNPEASAWIQSGTSFLSFPQAVKKFLIQDKRSIVCAGTHGKTSTTSWVAFLLESVGLNPSFLIGGVPTNLKVGSRLSKGEYFVGEGDEYDSAFFDKGPKFLHYSPHFLLLSSIEFDHADIYDSIEQIKSSFEKLISLLPGDGLCIAKYGDPIIMELLPDSLAPVQTFGNQKGAMWQIPKMKVSESGSEFEVSYKGRSLGVFQSPLVGEHNLWNILSGVICAVNLGISIDKIRPVVQEFRGVKRRQEQILSEPIVLIDDFAHHPTAVKATLSAMRLRFPDKKIWAIFEPRSATARRNVHQKEYVKAFDSADHVLVKSPYRIQELNENERFSVSQLVEDLNSAGKCADHFEDTQNILENFLNDYKMGEVAVVMSNGDFDKIVPRLVEKLRV